MAGNAKLTADGVVLTSGKPQRVFGFSFKASDGGEGGTVVLYSGTDATGTEIDRAVVAAGTVGRVHYGTAGRFFPGGCYADMTDCDYVDFEVEQVQS